MSEQDNGQQEKDWRDSEPFDAKKYKNFYQLAGGAVVTVVILLIGVAIFSTETLGYWQNIYATLVGTTLTIAVLDRRAEQRTVRERKEELILQMGSPDNGFAVEAVRLLRHKGWLENGSLRKSMLWRANLQNADLRRADLQNADLWGANLQSTDFRRANLESTDLWEANLQDTDFRRASLRGANLWETNLLHADLTTAEFSIDTILPDTSHWTPDRDMREFTHPDEWRVEQAAKESGGSN